MTIITITKNDKRNYSATTTINGVTVSGNGKQERTAVQDLVEKAKLTGDIEIRYPVPAPKMFRIEAPTVPTAPVAAPTPAPVAGPVPILTLPVVATPVNNPVGLDSDGFPVILQEVLPAGEDLPEMVIPVLPSVAGPEIKLTETRGLISPWTNLEQWKQIAGECITRMMLTGMPNDREAATNFRKGVDAMMFSLNAIGAYTQMATGPGSNSLLNMFGIPDPTIRHAQAGEGDRRERSRKFKKNELGDNAPKKSSGGSVPATEKVIVARIYDLAKDASARVRIGGGDGLAARNAFKAQTLVGFESQGVKFDKREKYMADLGLDEAKLAGVVARANLSKGLEPEYNEWRSRMDALKATKAA